jgi:hypothetical protein
MSDMTTQGPPSHTTDSDAQADSISPESDGTLGLIVHDRGTIKAGRPTDLSLVVTCVRTEEKGIMFECHVFAGSEYHNPGGRDKCAETVRSVLKSEKAEIERTTHYTSGRFVHPNSNQVRSNVAIAASDVAGIIRYHYEIAQPDLKCVFHGLGDTLLPGTFYPFSSRRSAGMATSSANQQSQRALRDAKQRGDISGYRDQLAQDDLLLYAMPIPIKWGSRGTSVELVKADPDHDKKNQKYLKGRNRARSAFTKHAVGTSEPRRERKSKYQLDEITPETTTPYPMTQDSLADNMLSGGAKHLAALCQAAGPRGQTITASTLSKPLPFIHAHAPGALDISPTPTFSSPNANLAFLSGLLPHTIFGSVNDSNRQQSLINPDGTITTQYLNPESDSQPGDDPTSTSHPIASSSAVPVRSSPRSNHAPSSQFGDHTAKLALDRPLERDWWAELMNDESDTDTSAVPGNATEPGQCGKQSAQQYNQPAQTNQSSMYDLGQTSAYHGNPNNPQAPWSQNQQSYTSGPRMNQSLAFYAPPPTGQDSQSFCPSEYVDPKALLLSHQGTNPGFYNNNSRPWSGGEKEP